MFFPYPARRASPVIRNVFEWSSRSYTVFGVTFCRIIDVSANDANVLFHNKCLLKSVCRWQVLCQDYVASLRFPLPYHGLSYERTKKRVLLSQNCFFVHQLPLRERALDGSLAHKKSATSWLRFFDSFVIRTGFEPVTHSLEGCCSIQLSYRTIPFEGAKI